VLVHFNLAYNWLYSQMMGTEDVSIVESRDGRVWYDYEIELRIFLLV
jgi:hypothetical protein